jgi:isopropylmalate/homocitrate/citramalate synthase
MDVTAKTRINRTDRAAIDRMSRRIGRSMDRLRTVMPYVLDLSVREGQLPAPYGYTLDDKIELFTLAREFGLRDLACVSYFDFRNIDVRFLEWLVETDVDRTGLFATVSTMGMTEGEAIVPNFGIERTLWAGIENVVIYLETRPSGLRTERRSRDGFLRIVADTVAFLRERLPRPTKRRGRIYMRLADVFDAWDEDPEFLVRVLKLFAALPVQGIMFEDVRGTHFPFHTAELVRLMRRYSPPPRLILLHPHSGNGMEDASVLEGVLAGADGVWAGFAPSAAQGYHGSTMMLIANLLRAGNRKVARTFRVERLAEIGRRMSRIHMGEEIAPDYPVIGAHAYRYIDPAFQQVEGRSCDLPPGRIGLAPGVRVTPAWAPEWTIGKRLEELGYPKSVFGDRALLRAMRVHMAEANIAGKRVRFDDPDEMAKLVDACRGRGAGAAG